MHHSFSELVELVGNVLGVPSDRLTSTSGPANISEWDSVNALRILMHVERDLGIALPLVAFNRIRTLGELAELVTTVGRQST